MEDNNTESNVPAADLPPTVPAADVAPPVEPATPKPDETPAPDAPPAGEAAKPDGSHKPDEPHAPDEPHTASAIERLGSPLSRLRTMHGAPVVGLAASAFVLLVATVLLALMVFAPAVAPFRLGSTKAGVAAQRDLAAEKVAVRFATNLMTFDYRTLDLNLTAMSKDVTGTFLSQIRSLRKDPVIRGKLVEVKASSKCSIYGDEVRSVRGDTATVRVFLLQTVTNSASNRAEHTFRINDFTLVKTAGGWKVDSVNGQSIPLTGNLAS